MAKQDALDNLIETFRLLGADDPESWAASEVEEGIPQLAMYVFLRRALELFGERSLERWLQSAIHGHAGHASGKQALSRILEQGISLEDVRCVLKSFGQDTLMELCCLIDNTSSSHFDDDQLNRKVAHVDWRLYTVDDKGNPTSPMEGLHEIVNDVADQAAQGRESEESS